MSGIGVVVLIFFVLAAGLGAFAYFTYQRKLRRAKAIERGLKMVPILIHLPPPSADTEAGNRDMREVMREKTSQAEVLYNLISGTATEGFKSTFYGQRHIALEVIAIDGVVHFYASVPVALVSVINKAIQTAYPGARLEEVEDYNIFNQEGRLAATLGGEMVLRQDYTYPIATYDQLERDPMEALLTTISALGKKDGVAVQIMLRPANRSWTAKAIKQADNLRKGKTQNLSFSARELAAAAFKAPSVQRAEERELLGHNANIGQQHVSKVDESLAERIEDKIKHPGFEVLIRVIVSTESVARSQQLLRDIATAFALFETPGLNGFKFLPALDVQGLVTAFIFRFFPPELKSNILNSAELATLFHFPDSQFTPTMSIERQLSKQVDGPVHLAPTGLLFGHNDFRGVQKEIRLSAEDRRRHTYILGQTGTGKSTMLENLAVQDMLAGGGFAFIDPHGDSAEKLLAMVPKERAEDIIYFNPSDTEYPLGLNLFEFTDPSQKDFLVQETINMLYKLYDPGKTGIIGPRYEHWYRNAALTLMSDPNGSTFIEIPKVFTDTEYLKTKFKYLKDPTVIDFWTKEMGQTSDYHKSEMLGWFVSKFGAFQNNEMMRNIIGQTKSSFNMREVMDNKKILIVNLSKGRIGELNSQLLGMIFVIKFQAAAMSRADVPEDQRADFCMYVDEFQNFSTDSFASILSEARKYRLNLTVANQFIGQLSEEIRDAVFGNIGTIVAHRMGPDDAEFMVKQFAPVFDASDLVNIPNYNSVVRLMIGGLPSQPFTMRDSAPLGSPNLELGLAVKQLSAAKYGHTKAMVEADILERFSGKGPVAAPTAAVGAPAAPAPAPASDPTPAAVPAATVAPPAPVAAPVGVPAAPAIDPAMIAPVPPVTAPAVAAPAPMSAATPPASVPTAPVAPQPAAFAPVTPASVPSAPASVPAAATPAASSAMPAAPMPGAVVNPVVSPPQEAVMTNTAGQVMTATSPIIPEDNDDSIQANDPVMEGGFGDLSAPLGAPAVPPASDNNAAPLAQQPGMAVTPPPIGAPPVDIPPIGAPPIGAPPVDAVAAPVPPQDMMPAPMPVAAAPMMPQVPEPMPIQAAPAVYQPAPEPALAMQYTPASVPAAAPAPVAPVMPPAPVVAPMPVAPVAAVAPVAPAPVALTPPMPVAPIGAPPVEVPLPAQVAPVMAQSQVAPVMAQAQPIMGTPAPTDPGTLSLSDITGGKPLPRVLDLSSVPVIAPGAEPPRPVVASSAAASVPAPAEPLVPLGSGRPLEGDPYANIDVLGDLTPPGGVASAGELPMNEGSRGPDPTGQPLPNDPYAGVDILGTSPLPEERNRAQFAPVAPTPAPSPAAAVVTPPQPVAPQPPVPEPEPVPMPAPMSAPVPVVPAVVQPPVQSAPTPAPLPEPVVSEPVPVMMAPAPQPVAPPAPVVAEPAVLSAPVPVPAPMSEPLAAPMPEPPAPVAAEPAPAVSAAEPETPPLTDEPFIHFVDPGAEEVLKRPDVPDAMTPQNDDALMLSGLPEGVSITKQEAPLPVPAPVPAPVAPPAATQPPAASAPVVPVEPKPPVAESVPAPKPAPSLTSAAPLEKMAKTPPPIGAAPVDIGAAPTPPKPAPETAPVAEVPQPKKEAIPEMNATLAQALAKPEPAPAPTPEPAPKEAAEVPVEPVSPDKLKSVADMLGTKPKSGENPKPEAKTDVKPEGKAEVKEEAKPEAKPAEEPKTAEPAAAPAEAVAKPAAPTTGAQIEKAEHEIDDLLSVSLIKTDSASTSHHRLPEPVAAPQNETGVDLEMNAGRPVVAQAPAGTPQHMAEHHGLKVIQPLEPIVPPKERFAKELAALQRVEQAAATGPKAPTSTPAPKASPVPPAPQAAQQPPRPVAPTPAAATPAAAPTAPAASPAVVKHEGAMMPAAPAPAAVETESGLPESVSLAANDVAKARAEREAAEAMQKPLPQSDAPVATPAQPMVTSAASEIKEDLKEEVNKFRHRREEKRQKREAEQKQQELLAKKAGEKPQDKPVENSDEQTIEKPAEKITEKPAEAPQGGKSAEKIESAEEAEHNKPSEAGKEQGSMVGKLIVPTGEKPKPEPVQPKLDKPKKLAPGEVFVDEHGNVVIGE